ncbi:hypothetical protein DFH09DRAFT_1369615 [Mycena vulgaris]|nr:hypothetical protein DFH09DRAFT_1369615 [Mycena vulgaris]
MSVVAHPILVPPPPHPAPHIPASAAHPSRDTHARHSLFLPEPPRIPPPVSRLPSTCVPVPDRVRASVSALPIAAVSDAMWRYLSRVLEWDALQIAGMRDMRGARPALASRDAAMHAGGAMARGWRGRVGISVVRLLATNREGMLRCAGGGCTEEWGRAARRRLRYSYFAGIVAGMGAKFAWMKRRRDGGAHAGGVGRVCDSAMRAAAAAADSLRAGCR